MTTASLVAPKAADAESLPAGWTWTTVGDVTHLNPRLQTDELADDALVTFVPMAAVDADSGTIANAELRPLGSVRKGFTAFREGDVIMAKITPCMENGKAAVARDLCNGLGFGSTEFHVMRPTDAITAEYLYHFIRQESFRQAAEPHMTGNVGQRRVPGEYLATHPIPLPPLAEQRRIVAALDAALVRVNAARARLARVRETLKRYRAAVLSAAVAGRLTEDWRAAHADVEPAAAMLRRILDERRRRWEQAEQAKYAKAGKQPPFGWREKYKEPPAPDTSALPALPEGWCWATTAQLLGEPLSNGRSVPDAIKGFPVLRLSAIKQGTIYLADHKIGAWSLDEAQRFLVQLGDFLVARGNGSIKLVGRGGLVKEEHDPVAYPDTMIRVRLDEQACCREFLPIVWDSEVMRGQIEKTAHTTAGIHKISQSHIGAFAFPVPPFKEQREIVRRVERLLGLADAVEERGERTARGAEGLTGALLAQAFRGELVAQDPADEPAGVLLDRVRTGQGAASRISSRTRSRQGRPL